MITHGFSPRDVDYMARAMRLAQRGLYTADPNPRVGCVLVDHDRIVGEGWHERAGEPHAEIRALQAAGELARGATAYVTLEPCSHYGKTPPCADALIEAGVGRVVAAVADPNPLVSGQGLARLEAAGISVESGLLDARAMELNAGFVKRMVYKRPLVRLKVAVSLDGRTALPSGESRWITGAPARADVHRLRARSSAVLTGIGTVLADDPQLTARNAGFDVQRQPLRVILDSHRRLTASARLLNDGGKTLILTTNNNAPPLIDGARIETVRRDGDHLDLHAVVARLAQLSCNEVLVEAGARLNGALLRAGLVDELIVYVAPTVLGDRGLGMFSLPAMMTMEERPQMNLIEQRRVGSDLRLRYRLAEN